MKSVRLIPGYLSSDLGLSPGPLKVWWDPVQLALAAPGCLRLAPNGIDPGPPDGLACGLMPTPQAPWDTILQALGRQLGTADWKCEVDGYDWRKDITVAAQTLADSVAAESSNANPATLVGHSTGGLIALLAYQILANAGNAGLVRRIVTICCPIQGCYCPIDVLRGVAASIEQVIGWCTFAVRINLAAPTWSIRYLANIALTWPSFYQLYPALGGTAAAQDLFRESVYIAARYPAGYTPSQSWLNYAVNTFQPLMSAAAALPPSAVLTCVVSTGLSTDNALTAPLAGGKFPELRNPATGDSVTSAIEQSVPQAAIVELSGSHASVPLGITQSGLLAQLILDPRVPPAPVPGLLVIDKSIPMNTDGPPLDTPVTGLTCIGGHC